jgi:hypothetical protein
MARAAVESTAAAMGAGARRCGGDGTVLEQALPRPGRSSLPPAAVVRGPASIRPLWR